MQVDPYIARGAVDSTSHVGSNSACELPHHSYSTSVSAVATAVSSWSPFPAGRNPPRCCDWTEGSLEMHSVADILPPQVTKSDVSPSSCAYRACEHSNSEAFSTSSPPSLLNGATEGIPSASANHHWCVYCSAVHGDSTHAGVRRYTRNGPAMGIVDDALVRNGVAEANAPLTTGQYVVATAASTGGNTPSVSAAAISPALMSSTCHDRPTNDPSLLAANMRARVDGYRAQLTKLKSSGEG